MKCAEFEKDVQLLLDGEIELPTRKMLTEHLTDCHLCGKEFAELRQFKKLIKAQSAILPNDSFDNRMLRIIGNHKAFQPKKKQNRFASIFTFSKPVFAAGLFTLAVSLAFFLGRISVSQTSPLSAEMTRKENAATVEKAVVLEPIEKIVTQTKVVTKTIEVPVIREKIVEKKIYINNQFPPKSVEIASRENTASAVNKQSRTKQAEDAKQFNLKDLQPVANVTYQVIRKGENNE